MRRAGLVLVLGLALTACGGGGGSGMPVHLGPDHDETYVAARADAGLVTAPRFTQAQATRAEATLCVQLSTDPAGLAAAVSEDLAFVDAYCPLAQSIFDQAATQACAAAPPDVGASCPEPYSTDRVSSSLRAGRVAWTAASAHEAAEESPGSTGQGGR